MVRILKSPLIQNIYKGVFKKELLLFFSLRPTKLDVLSAPVLRATTPRTAMSFRPFSLPVSASSGPLSSPTRVRIP